MPMERGCQTVHDIIIWRASLCAKKAKRYQCTAIGHHVTGGARDFGKGIGRYHHGIFEILAARIHIGAF